MMRAIVMEQYGGADELRLNENYPAPQVRPGTVLVRVHASTINPGMIKRVSGALRGVLPDLDFPFVPGTDFSGVVSAVGDGMTDYVVGDEVYGIVAQGGAYAESVLVDQNAVSRKPDGVTHGEAASLALAVQTAAHVVDVAKVMSGQKLVILGAGGSVGNALIQVARLRGAEIIAVARSRSLSRLAALGASAVIDSAAGIDAVPAGVDVVVNALGPDLDEPVLRHLRSGGYLLTLNAPPPMGAAEALGVHAHFINALASPRGPLDDLRDDIAAGRIAPFIGRTFPLDQTAEAWKLYGLGEVEGKIVVDSAPMKR